MNFNFDQKAEYALNTSLVEEMINLYGVPTKFLLTEKINIDDNVFGDFSHMKTNSENIYEMFMLPENSEDWDSEGYNFSNFGLTNLDNITLFVAKSNFDDIAEVQEITGNLIIFPNNKIMEITDTKATVPGINNLFTYNDAKSVYQLSCKPYNAKLNDELDTSDISVDDTPYTTLDDYFQELIDMTDNQDIEAEVLAQVNAVESNDVGVDEVVKKPIVDKSEDDVFGKFS